jgi:hypothetical protein
MKKKKAAKAKKARDIRNLPAKTLTAKQARSVKGGADYNWDSAKNSKTSTT